MDEMQPLPRYYILVGDSITWKISLDKKMWGFSKSTKKLWNKCNIGDYLAFYIVSPISKIIGFGKITEKFIDYKIIWYDEKIFRKPIWIYRIHYDIICNIDSWENGITVPSNIILNTGRKVVDEITFKQIKRDAEKKWNTTIKL